MLRAMPSLVDITVSDGDHFTVCGDVHGQVRCDLGNLIFLSDKYSFSNIILQYDFAFHLVSFYLDGSWSQQIFFYVVK